MPFYSICSAFSISCLLKAKISLRFVILPATSSGLDSTRRTWDMSSQDTSSLTGQVNKVFVYYRRKDMVHNGLQTLRNWTVTCQGPQCWGKLINVWYSYFLWNWQQYCLIHIKYCQIFYIFNHLYISLKNGYNLYIW